MRDMSSVEDDEGGGKEGNSGGRLNINTTDCRKDRKLSG